VRKLTIIGDTRVGKQKTLEIKIVVNDLHDVLDPSLFGYLAC